VPRFDAPNAWADQRYEPCVGEEDFDQSPGAVKTFGHLACEARSLDAKGRWIGTDALMTLKGDVDNLGQIFQGGLDAPSFARMAALSRQMHAFFSIYLPWMCYSEFPNTYTVFAGGDDFFLIGPWRQQVRLAQRLRDEFDRYVARNPEVHFSSGLLMTKAGLPVRYLATAAERALESAKDHRGTGDKVTKNAVTCFGETVAWPDFGRLLSASDHLGELTQDFGLSTRYLHGLLELLEMAENVKRAKAVHPEDARWRAHFHYRTYRMLERSRMNQEQRKRVLAQLASVIAKDGIERFGQHYRIALFSYLYQQRD
jgi:CRISPR-associated protein Csm1